MFNTKLLLALMFTSLSATRYDNSKKDAVMRAIDYTIACYSTYSNDYSRARYYPGSLNYSEFISKPKE